MGLIIVLVVLLLLSAFFSATETAFSTMNKIRMKNYAAAGKRNAMSVLKLHEKYDLILSTILIGNNIANIAAASIATLIFTKYYDDMGVTISTVVMTIVVLFFGEITPKSLAKEYPESFSLFSAPILKFFTIVLYPLNFIFMQWKKLLTLVFKTDNDRSITEEELITIVDEAESGGGIDKHESELIRSAIEFNDLDVIDIITPRVDIVAVAKDMDLDTISELFLQHGFSRMPVYIDNIDNIVGVIHEKDFHGLISKKRKTISSIINPIVSTTPSTKISTLLRQLQRSKSHLSVVIDEFGGTLGIVTLEDILEELVGEIWDEHDDEVDYFKKVDDDSYIITASANLDEFFKMFNLNATNQEYISTTVSGWVVEEFEKIPHIGDSITYENFNVEVTKADAKRVLEIKITDIAKLN